MHILLIGKNTTVTKTVEKMLTSTKEWTVTKLSSLNFSNTHKVERNTLDIVIANLADFSTPPQKNIQKITDQFLSIPLLVLYSYGRKLLINPLIDAGATGYLQHGISETELHKAVETISNGEKYVGVETTY